MTPAAAADALDTAAIWQALADDLRVYLRRRVADRAAAEDLLQEVFVRVHAHRHRLRHHERVAAWVYRIARHAIADHYRSLARSARAPEPTVAPSELEREHNEAGAALGTWIRRMLDTLPLDCRAALQLTEVEGLSQREAAQRLGLSYSGLKSRVQRGRARLRKLLMRCCEVHLDRTGGVMDYRPRRGDPCCP